MDWNGTFASRPQPTLNSHYNYNYDQCPVKQGQKSSYNAQEKTTTVYWRGVSRKEEMKLSRELGHQPRQIVIWFQCRRAEWKAKQLERLYDTLKHDYDVISREKQKLQDEVNYLAEGLMDNVQNPDSLSMHMQVMKWKGMLVQQATREQVVSTVDTKISGEETVESTSVPSSNKTTVAASPHVPIPECNYVFNLLTGGAKLPSYP
ncbi:hypothetical protein GOBAR_AA27259 [Gossypium barbadense]|uniref:Homeobox-leucine zipper protein n=1 Tax=Gossypium barbadense TaxID=3634 RepID=A0A2P5WQQ4_GOSBA|nr:hypothetical protein GOBAR_AA27259 [Gossypium barbadense]